MNALLSMLGGGDVVTCRVLSNGVSVHWWKGDAKPGDRCLCGESVRPDDSEDESL